MAYSGGELTYVCDYKETKSSAYASSMLAKRLYSSGIDEKKIEELSQSLLTTEFTEEERRELFRLLEKLGKNVESALSAGAER